MASELKASKDSPKKSYKRWEKSIRTGDITKSVEVKEAENGFVITISIWGNKNGKYFDENKCYISKSNPLADTEMDEMDKIQSSIKEMEGMSKGASLFNE